MVLCNLIWGEDSSWPKYGLQFQQQPLLSACWQKELDFHPWARHDCGLFVNRKCGICLSSTLLTRPCWQRKKVINLEIRGTRHSPAAAMHADKGSQKGRETGWTDIGWVCRGQGKTAALNNPHMAHTWHFQLWYSNDFRGKAVSLSNIQAIKCCNHKTAAC